MDFIASARILRKQCLRKPFLSTASTVVPTSVPEPFLLRIQVNGPQSPLRRKRQESSLLYLEDEFSTSLRCEDGAQFRLVNGQLLRDGLVISVSDPPAPQPLLEAGRAGGISTTFYFTDRILLWSNPRFPRQTASFCLSTETAFVYFGTAPGGCIDVTLLFTPCESSFAWISMVPRLGSLLPTVKTMSKSSLICCLVSECPGLQSLSTTASSISPSTSGSQPSSAPISSIRLSSSTEMSSGSTPSEASTSKFSSTAVGTSSEASTQDINTTISDSLVVTTTPSQTTLGTLTQLSSFETSNYTSSRYDFPPESTSGSSSAMDVSLSQAPTSSITQSTQESPTSSAATSASSSQSSSSLSVQSTQSETSTSSSTSSSSSGTSSSSTVAEPSSTPNTAGTFPASIGAATLIAPPIGPENNVQFGFNTDTVGSFGYTGLPTGDDIGFYTTNTPASVEYCDVVGYLYHKRSGLCVTAIAPVTPTTAKYTAANVQLQPCDITGPEPPDAQKFCGRKQIYFSGGRKQSFFGVTRSVYVQFQGERTSGGPYASRFNSYDGPALESLLFPYGAFWIYDY